MNTSTTQANTNAYPASFSMTFKRRRDRLPKENDDLKKLNEKFLKDDPEPRETPFKTYYKYDRSIIDNINGLNKRINKPTNYDEKEKHNKYNELLNKIIKVFDEYDNYEKLNEKFLNMQKIPLRYKVILNIKQDINLKGLKYIDYHIYINEINEKIMGFNVDKFYLSPIYALNSWTNTEDLQKLKNYLTKINETLKNNYLNINNISPFAITKKEYNDYNDIILMIDEKHNEYYLDDDKLYLIDEYGTYKRIEKNIYLTSETFEKFHKYDYYVSMFSHNCDKLEEEIKKNGFVKAIIFIKKHIKNRYNIGLYATLKNDEEYITEFIINKYDNQEILNENFFISDSFSYKQNKKLKHYIIL